jgi:type IV pilus assembly protein PilB
MKVDNSTKMPTTTNQPRLRILPNTSSPQPPVTPQEISDGTPVAQTVTLMLQSAIRANATDIHIEPQDDSLQIRYRIDGLLRPTSKLPLAALAKLIARIKLLADLQIDEHRSAQMGRMRADFDGQLYALHISILPVIGGEKAVIRILQQPAQAPTLENLGWWGPNLDIFNNAVVQPNGLVMVAGPKGSGTSTTLYAALSALNNPALSIATIEDPVAYKITGATQTQVNARAGLTFATGLKALLRQDANILLVGELYEREAASLAVQASLSGHLVCATVRSGSAVAAVLQCLAMGVEPYLLASTVRAVASQRLVRVLCEHCKKEYQPNKNQTSTILTALRIQQKTIIARLAKLEEQALKQGIGKEKKALSIKGNTVNRLYKASEQGCDACGHTGYKGQTGIFEVLPITVTVQNLLIHSPTATALQDQAIADGMVPMQVDGFIKALRGVTSIEEVLRVAQG